VATKNLRDTVLVEDLGAERKKIRTGLAEWSLLDSLS
jgi:hypothetical protein